MSAPDEDYSDYSDYEEKKVIINTCEECRDRLGWYLKQKEIGMSNGQKGTKAGNHLANAIIESEE